MKRGSLLESTSMLHICILYSFQKPIQGIVSNRGRKCCVADSVADNLHSKVYTDMDMLKIVSNLIEDKA